MFSVYSFLAIVLLFTSGLATGSLTKPDYNNMISKYGELQNMLHKACENFQEKGFETFLEFCKLSRVSPEHAIKLNAHRHDPEMIEENEYWTLFVEIIEGERKLTASGALRQIVSGLLLATGVSIVYKDGEITNELIEESIKDNHNVKLVRSILERIREIDYDFEEVDPQLEKLIAVPKDLFKYGHSFPSLHGMNVEAMVFQNFALENSSAIDFAENLLEAASGVREYTDKLLRMAEIELKDIEDVEQHIDTFVWHAAIVLKTHSGIQYALGQAGFRCDYVKCSKKDDSNVRVVEVKEVDWESLEKEYDEDDEKDDDEDEDEENENFSKDEL